MRRALLLLSFAALTAASGGCQGPTAHVFGAQRYDEKRDCLEEPAALDVLDGPDPGPCDRLRCWHAPDGQVYVTSQACAAPPDFADHTSDPAGSLCAKALAAFKEKDPCFP